MTRDHLAELVLIDLSRLQRETVLRWIPILVDAGEVEEAERLRREITDYETRKEAA